MNFQELMSNTVFVITAVIIIVLLGVLFLVARFYKKAHQGQALVRTGVGGTRVSFNGIFVIPVLHKLEIMDISLKTIEIARQHGDGLICKDNIRADIKVTFFVRVNELQDDVKKVAQTVGCKRAASPEAIVQLFDAKFSEALKTVGKQFDFVDLYNKRDEFREQIVNVIGTDLNGFILDDAAIDYLEQTSLEYLKDGNILDAEGIKKITELTATQHMKANFIRREEEKTITQQNVDAKEAILEMERQLAEKEEKQKREVANIKAREAAEIAKVNEEELKKSEMARIQREEEVMVMEENKQRQIIVAAKNKEKTEAIETERVEKERALEQTERERIVTLAQIEKEKAIEVEKKNIQEVIRERVAIEKTVVDEEERINDTRAFAEADRAKKVAITHAEKLAEEQLVQKIKSAEADKQAAEFKAKQMLIDAEAEQLSSVQKADAIKTLAEAKAAEYASTGMAEAQVMEAKAAATEKQGEADANILEAKAEAEAKGIEMKGQAQAAAELKLGEAQADVLKGTGLAEAEVIAAKAVSNEKAGLVDAKVAAEKFKAEADGITQKADAMKKLDGVGKEHEEFKLRLQKDKEVELASIGIQKDIADAQAVVLAEALKSAHIDIVGGEQEFFDKITDSITKGKRVDRLVDNSDLLSEVKNQLLHVEGETFVDKLKTLVKDSNVKSEDIKNLTISALIAKMMSGTNDGAKRGILGQLMKLAESIGIADSNAGKLGL
ncbi:flotillin family protein [Paracrocinitomix mangrovi]|uniref:flotillin family protein n=1 Tax=Paracrocinitomix mangrovi TaxID=2862509 RepID=UPI001EDBAD39|nr:flotillin family protein [Paracrocinitomix mangrovi]UKN01919.1 flotillin family protein [Paracrocinitomix mangrovi]